MKSMSVQSCTPTELFFRCSPEFPQVTLGAKKEASATRLWWGQAFNCDEAYEFLESFSLLSSAHSASDRASVNAHASTLNTLIAQGKTKRATRTSTTHGGSIRAPHISLSVLGNGHPAKLVSMERQNVGVHHAATKERFLLVADTSVARHDALPRSAGGTYSQRWSWLPLTPLQASIFHFEDLHNNPAYFRDRANRSEMSADMDEDADDLPEDELVETVGPSAGYPVVLPDGVPSRVRYVRIPATASALLCAPCGLRFAFQLG